MLVQWRDLVFHVAPSDRRKKDSLGRNHSRKEQHGDCKLTMHSDRAEECHCPAYTVHDVHLQLRYPIWGARLACRVDIVRVTRLRPVKGGHNPRAVAIERPAACCNVDRESSLLNAQKSDGSASTTLTLSLDPAHRCRAGGGMSLCAHSIGYAHRRAAAAVILEESLWTLPSAMRAVLTQFGTEARSEEEASVGR